MVWRDRENKEHVLRGKANENSLPGASEATQTVWVTRASRFSPSPNLPEFLSSASFSRPRPLTRASGLPSPAPGLTSPAPAYSPFPVQRQLHRLQRREPSEWRVSRSQNTTRSQNAARRTRPLPFLSGERGLAFAAFLFFRLGNVDSAPIVPTPEERAGDRVQVPPETLILRPSRRGRGPRVSKHLAPGTGWTARRGSGAWARGSGAAGSGAEGQDLPSQFNLWNPAPPGKGLSSLRRGISPSG